MSLFLQTTGEGPDIVFLHGWGMNAEVWFEIQQAMEKAYRVTVIDLPGYGRSKDHDGSFELDKLVKLIASHITDHSIIVGWSLGGLIAQGIAIDFPDKIRKLVLVASNAQFQQSDDWKCAMKTDVLDGFIKNLHQDYKSTLQH